MQLSDAAFVGRQMAGAVPPGTPSRSDVICGVAVAQVKTYTDCGLQEDRFKHTKRKQQGTGQQTPRKVRKINKSIRNSPERKRREPHLSSVKEYVHRRWRTLIKDISGLSSTLAISRAYQKRRLAHHGGAFSMLPNEECVHTCAGQA